MDFLGPMETIYQKILNDYNRVKISNSQLTSYWILLIKPDGMEKDVFWVSFKVFLFRILYDVGFLCRKRKKVYLDKTQLVLLFPPLVSDLELREWWKSDFEEHMLNKQMEALLLYGENAIENLCLLKVVIRSNLLWERKNNYSGVIANLLHSVDEEDFEISYQVLFH